MARDREPWFKVKIGIRRSGKMAELPSDSARLGYVYVLAEAKVQRCMGVFDSQAHFTEVLGRFARFLPQYLAGGLIHEAPLACADCKRRHAGLRKGQLVVHDYLREQRDPTNADRQAAWREAHGDAPDNADRNAESNGDHNADRNADERHDEGPGESADQGEPAASGAPARARDRADTQARDRADTRAGGKGPESGSPRSFVTPTVTAIETATVTADSRARPATATTTGTGTTTERGSTRPSTTGGARAGERPVDPSDQPEPVTAPGWFKS